MKTIDFSNFIERYNAGEMDHIEKRWFEKELSGNDTLQNEVNFRKRVDNALIQHDLISLRNKLSVLEKNRKEKSVSSPGKKAIGIRFAAAVAALLVIGSIYILISGNNTRESLYNTNYEVYGINAASRSENGAADAEFRSAIRMFSDLDYSGAAASLGNYLKSHPANMEARFIYGVSEMENQNFNGAISSFRKIIEHDNNLYLDKAQWYISLCYLKTGDLNETTRHLDAIINSESIYKVKAKRLLRKIR
jgi:tetratricopeptide (TPR) repeat protein